MAITRVQVSSGGGDGNQGNSIPAVFGSSVTSGNLLIAIARDSNLFSITIADTVGTNYQVAASNLSRDPALVMWWGFAPSSGANTVTLTYPTFPSDYPWLYLIELSGNWASAGSVVNAADDELGTGVTDIVAGAISTTCPTGYFVVGVGQSGLGTYTAGTDFTLVDGTIPTNPSNFGGVEERILSSTLSTYVAHITSSITSNYTLVAAVFAEVIPEIPGKIIFKNRLG